MSLSPVAIGSAADASLSPQSPPVTHPGPVEPSPAPAPPVRLPAKSRLTKLFCGLSVCIAHLTTANPDALVPHELWNALFHAAALLAEIKNRPAAATGSQAAASPAHAGASTLDDAPPLAPSTRTNAPPTTTSFGIEDTGDLLGHAAASAIADLRADELPTAASSAASSATSVGEPPSPSTMSRACGIQRLPNELLHNIFSRLKICQVSLYAATLACKRFSGIGLRIIYRHAHIASPKALVMFTEVLAQSARTEAAQRGSSDPRLSLLSSSAVAIRAASRPASPTWLPYANLVRTIAFEPCVYGSLDTAAVEPHIHGIDNVRAAHSSIFRYLVHSREPAGSPSDALRQNNQPNIRLEPLSSIVARPPVPDAIFLLLVVLCPKLEEMEDRGAALSAERAKYELAMQQQRTRVSGTWQRITPSSMALTMLVRACRRWVSGVPEWRGFELDQSRAFVTTALMLESLEGEFPAVWDGVGARTVRCLRPLLHARCRAALSAISTALLLQVQFLTSCSQRLLDCYCLIYYSALALARSLNVSRLIATKEGKGLGAYERVHLGVPLAGGAGPSSVVVASPAQIDDEDDSDAHGGEYASDGEDGLAQAEPLLPDSSDGEAGPAASADSPSEAESSSDGSVPSDASDLSTRHIRRRAGKRPAASVDEAAEQQQPSQLNMQAAAQIFDAILILFRRRLSSPPPTFAGTADQNEPAASATGSAASDPAADSPGSASTGSASTGSASTGSASTGSAASSAAQAVTAATLRDSILSFPPTAVNTETVELIQHIADTPFNESEPSGAEIKRWLRWLREIGRWHVASRQMEPVKDLLRQSMHKIDQLRGMQRRFGLSFMD
ncbi:hypothetical protein HK105_204452 [Polyrhizophydium stewartii]|uniref:F-box domain-containing protein n=1 Tax=Polyrhizophydium stewartii TaxID=2732419 RepID=A0ABR4N921_9FUNG